MKCRGEGDGCYGRVNARGSLWALCGINTHQALLSQPRFQGNKSPSFLPRAQNWVFPFLPPASAGPHSWGAAGEKRGLILAQGWKWGSKAQAARHALSPLHPHRASEVPVGVW